MRCITRRVIIIFFVQCTNMDFGYIVVRGRLQKTRRPANREEGGFEISDVPGQGGL